MTKTELNSFVKLHPAWVEIDGQARLRADIAVPPSAIGLVVIPVLNEHGRKNSLTSYLSRALIDQGVACLVVELLSEKEQAVDTESGATGLDAELLADRIVGVVDWLIVQKPIEGLKIGLYATGELTSSATLATIRRYKWISTIVCCDGRFDQALSTLRELDCPILSIVPSDDNDLRLANEKAFSLVSSQKQMSLRAGSIRQYDEPGYVEETVKLAIDWFQSHLV